LRGRGEKKVVLASRGKFDRGSDDTKGKEKREKGSHAKREPTLY